MRKGKDKGCCKLNKMVLSPASLVMLIALALGSYAIDCGFETPSNSGTLNERTLINVSFSNAGNVAQLSVIINATSASTANSSISTILITNISNSSVNAGGRSINGSMPLSANLNIEDADDYILTASIENATARTTCNSTRTGIVLDREVPQIPVTLSPTGRLTSRSQTIQAVVIGENTTSCRLTFIGSNPGQKEYTMTHTGNNCSQTFSYLASTTFRYTISATDGTNRSDESAETRFNVEIAGASGARKYIAATGGKGGALPSQARSTARDRAFGQQAEGALDRAIAKAPADAQAGLTKAKESVTKQYKGTEGFKTWTGTGVGCGFGALGLIVPPLAIVSIPVGCVVGHLVGAVI